MSTEKGEMSKKARRREQLKRETEGMWKIKLGLGILLGLLGSLGLFQFAKTVLIATRGNNVKRIDVSDTPKLKQVLFGGEPWFIQCVQTDSTDNRVPVVLERHSQDMEDDYGVQVGTMDCWRKTESGRSIVDKFKLTGHGQSLSFFIANNERPEVINLANVNTYEAMERKLKAALKMDVQRIDTLKKFGGLCTTRRTCVIIGYKNGAQMNTALNLVTPLLPKHRTVKVVSLDTQFWMMKLQKEFVATRPEGEKGADIVCLVREDGPGKNATFRGAFLQNLENLDPFMAACLDRDPKLNLMQLEGVPEIKARPSKPKVIKAPPLGEEGQESANVEHVETGEDDEDGEDAFAEKETKPLVDELEEGGAGVPDDLENLDAEEDEVEL